MKFASVPSHTQLFCLPPGGTVSCRAATLPRFPVTLFMSARPPPPRAERFVTVVLLVMVGPVLNAPLPPLSSCSVRQVAPTNMDMDDIHGHVSPASPCPHSWPVTARARARRPRLLLWAMPPGWQARAEARSTAATPSRAARQADGPSPRLAPVGRGPAIDEDETQDGLDGEVYSQGVTLGAGGIAERQAAGPAHAPRQPGTGGLSGRVRAPPGDRSVGHHARADAARLPAGNAVEMLAEVRAWIRATAADAAAEDERREEARARREREREQFRSQERAQLLQERAQLLQQSLAFMGELTLKVAAQSAELGRAGPPRWPWPEDRPPGAEAPALAGPGAARAGGAAGAPMADAQPPTAATSSAESSPILRAASPGAEPRAARRTSRTLSTLATLLRAPRCETWTSGSGSSTTCWTEWMEGPSGPSRCRSGWSTPLLALREILLLISPAWSRRRCCGGY